MRNITTWDKFISENSDVLEFPLKKFMSIIKIKIDGNIKNGENIFHFDFSKEKKLKIDFNLIINYSKLSNNRYYGSINIDDVLSNNFTNFKININVESSNLDLNKLLSVIQHELKHVYDLYWDNNRETFLQSEQYSILKRNYGNNKYLLHFLELIYLTLKHELEARKSMIYDQLRWLKTYDKDQLLSEYKQSYVYKSLIMIGEFDAFYIIDNVDYSILKKFTNDFIINFIKSDKLVNTKSDIFKFYLDIEDKFKKLSVEYLKKSEDIIDELVKDKTPYMERISTTPDFYKVDETYYNYLINDIFIS